MSIMEISLLTGHVADNVDQLQSQSSLVKRVDSDETKIVLYLDEVRTSMLHIHLVFTVLRNKVILSIVVPTSMFSHI